jgi:nucleoside-diphosphate-sugar epimerase
LILKRGTDRVLIAGASGFIGSRIYLELRKLGFKSTQDEIPFTKRQYDFSNFTETRDVIAAAKPNVVINCAVTRPQTSASMRQDNPSNHTIVETLVATLERLNEEVQFIQFGSAAEYAPTPMQITEENVCEPESSYGEDKLHSTKFLLALNSNISPVVLRPTTVYGQGQKPDMLIPAIAQSIATQHKVLISNPLAVRDFIHVDDVARACAMLVGDETSYREVYNLASGNALTVQSLLVQISETTGKSIDQFAELCENKTRPPKLDSLILSASKLASTHGWKPEVALRDGLREVFTNTGRT